MATAIGRAEPKQAQGPQQAFQPLPSARPAKAYKPRLPT